MPRILPLLYQVATGELSKQNITCTIDSLLEKYPQVSFLQDEVTGIEKEQKLVYTAQRNIPYDYVVVATGARPSYFGHDAWAEHALTLKSLEDAASIQQTIMDRVETASIEQDTTHYAELLTFVLVGGGPTGVELAGGIADLIHDIVLPKYPHIHIESIRIILIEAMPRILPAFPEKLALTVCEHLSHHGIEIRVNEPVKDITHTGVQLNTEFLSAGVVIWTAGVGASSASTWLHVDADRAQRVKVRSDLSVLEYPDIFVIGDTANVLQDGKPLPTIAPVAQEEGKYIGKVLAQRLQDKHMREPFFYIDKGSVAIARHGFAIAKFGKLQLSGWIAWLVWLAIHIGRLPKMQNRISVLRQWSHLLASSRRSNFPSRGENSDKDLA
jgi:NADH dehydrogenase